MTNPVTAILDALTQRNEYAAALARMKRDHDANQEANLQALVRLSRRLELAEAVLWPGLVLQLPPTTTMGDKPMPTDAEVLLVSRTARLEWEAVAKGVDA